MGDGTYRKIYNNLRKKILDKTLAEGDKVPPERVLCETYGVSRVTVRHALRMLHDQGLVERFPGKGTYVRPMLEKKIPILEIGCRKFMENEIPNIVRVLITWEKVPPPQQIMKQLGLLKSEECLLIEILEELHEHPLNVERRYIPADLINAVDQTIVSKHEFLRLWVQNNGLTISYIQSSTEAAASDKHTSKYLQISENTPILMTTEEVYSSDGRALAVFVTTYRADKYTLVSKNDRNMKYTKGYSM